MEDVRVKDEALRLIGLFEVLPRLVVFDLDYTLWPFYCELRSKREMPYLYPQAKGILQAFQDKGIEMAIASRSPTPYIANTFLDELGIQSMFVAKEIFSSLTYKAEHFKGIHRRTGVPFNSMLFFDDEYGNIDTFYAGDAIWQHCIWYLGYGAYIQEPEKYQILHSPPALPVRIRTELADGSYKFYYFSKYCKIEEGSDDSKLQIDVSKMGVTSILVDDGVNLQELRSGLEKFSMNSK